MSRLRYNAEKRQRVPVNCPKAAQAYNQHMGGTDKNDQLTKLQCCRRHYKWLRRLVVKFFMWCVYNAYILQDYYTTHQRPGSRPTTFHMFVEQICHELVGTHRTAAVNLPRRRSNADMSRLVNVGTVPTHTPERTENETRNHRCVVCTEKHKVAKR